jgi:uncharacterized protein
MQTIDVYALARTAGRLAGEMPLARLRRLATSLTSPDGVLRYACAGAIDALGRPGLNLHLQALLPVRCDRCGRPLAFALDVERHFFFVATEAELAAIPIDDAPQEALLGSVHFDLAGLIEDEAILQLPISPRHDDCVAPHATAGGAAAPAEQRRQPFAQLAALRTRLPAAGAAPPDAAAAAQILIDGEEKPAPAAAPRPRKRPGGSA